MDKTSKIYIAGHTGLVGSAVYRYLERLGFDNLIIRTHAELDLTDAAAVNLFLQQEKPDYIFMAAAKNGGIAATKQQPADYFYQNLMMNQNIIHAAYQHKVKKLLLLGSSCMYPQKTAIPITENDLFDGKLEPFVEPFGVMKLSILKMCQYYRRQYGCHFIMAIPCGVYGPNDNFDLIGSHILPGMMRRFYEAKIQQADETIIWGSGKPRREFLYVDDLADALLLLMQEYDDIEPINIGAGRDASILDVAQLMKKVVGFEGRLKTDVTKPDGTMQKLLDNSRISSLGWSPQVGLEAGLGKMFQYFSNLSLEKVA